MDTVDIVIVLAKAVAAFALLMVVTVLLVWAERKIVADMQNRLGPMRAGPFGILQTVADGLKLFFKEQITPAKSDVAIYLLAPLLAVVPAFLMFLVVPIGRPFNVTLGGQIREISLQAMDLNIGLLYILAISSVAVYAVVLAGWSSGSKYPLLGGVRATAQAISYEAAMGLALVALVVYASISDATADTLSVARIVELQQGTYATAGGSGILNTLAGFVPRWNIIPQFVAFGVFAVAAVAETNRAPFDLVEAEQEIVGGFHTEYSGMRFAMFFLAEYINMFTMSAIAVSLFLGGWSGPFLDSIGGFGATILSLVYFFAKVFVLLFMFIWLRASLPRLRYDQLMQLGWKRLIPTALVWLVASTLVVAWRQFGAPWA
ncbi:MAG: NADH-quinone oxidoreductase subunit NuoH [Acidimicrobiia bacterium]|nr:NADH-quinone oxidoreductase subunit NuoH [Acidimicrobiia bacterium]